MPNLACSVHGMREHLATDPPAMTAAVAAIFFGHELRLQLWATLSFVAQVAYAA